MAHKKAGGSAKNLRDSQPKYRGVKVFGGQKVVAGNIIIRQKGNKFECGNNVYMGRDFTILASVDGVVAFKKKKFERYDGRKYLKTVVYVDTNVATIEKQVVEKKTTVKKAAAPKKAADEKTVEKKATVKKAADEKTVEKKATVKKAAAPKKAAEKKTPAKK